jgi:hypothetical protein
MKLGKPNEGTVDLTELELPEMEAELTGRIFDELRRVAVKAAAEAVKYAVEDSSFAYFYADDDGNLKLGVSIELGDEPTTWLIDIEDAALINPDRTEQVADALERLAKSLRD